MEAYCMKCKSKKEMKSAKAITMKNGKPASKGVCPTCGTSMFRIGSCDQQDNYSSDKVDLNLHITELNGQGIKLLKIMLNKKLADTMVEIRHTYNISYKDSLKDRENEVRSLLERVSMGKRGTLLSTPGVLEFM